MLDAMTKDIVKSTIPILRQYGEDITRTFYDTLFEQYPEVKSMFNMQKQKSGEQPKALAMAILNAANNIDNLDNIYKSVESIGKVHVRLNVKPDHYPIVGECLLIAIKKVLGNAATQEVLAAWGNAYNEIANFYINIEKGIYENK